uniref:ATP-dependent DNA helicase n=1 Tax=Caenorhabditis tropicalis TaxID=1561998 RepID=A0A1I7T216_9PELO
MNGFRSIGFPILGKVLGKNRIRLAIIGLRLFESKKKVESDAVQKIHSIMCEKTGVPLSQFKLYNESSGNGRLHSNNFEMTGIELKEFSSTHFINFLLPMDNVCGSNAALRNLWIISSYIMFHGNETDKSRQIEFSEDSEEYAQRKRLFHQLKHLHKEVLNRWNKIRKYAHIKCKCFKLRKYHEQLYFFMTPLSHHDPIFEQFLLSGKTLMVTKSSIINLEHLIYEFVPTMMSSDGKSHKILVVDEVAINFIRKEADFIEWFENRESYLQDQSSRYSNLKSSLNVQDDSCKTGIESPLEMFEDILDFEKDLEESFFESNFQEKLDLEEARVRASNAVEEDDIRKTEEEVKECQKKVASKRFNHHLENELKLEVAVRNRVYRQSSCLPDLWVQGNEQLCTTDQYVAAFMECRGLLEKSVTDPNDAPDSSNKDHSSTLDVLFASYPPTVFLESRNDPCPFCGALAFPSERLRSCCKNGAIYVDPIKRLPSTIENIFQNKFRKLLIATNAAFSMASISYTRQTQKAHGVNSMKIKGVVSFHPSALHPNDPQRPRYANFIVLGTDNESIASERFGLLKCKNKSLKRTFEEVQQYLDENNSLYSCYKSMLEMEEEYLKESDEPDASTDSLKFRIVSPNELDEKDAKALAHHKGVYAKPSRMGSGYITVAYTFNSESSVPIPRGLTIHPRNPSTTPQMPLSIFSDMCDLMCYPLFHPEGTGGWALHKFPRWTAKGPRPTYEMRREEHIRNLKKKGENPDDYYVISDKGDVAMDQDESENVQVDMEALDDVSSKQVQDSDDEEDHDPMNLDDEEIFQHGHLEDLQEVPNSDDIGQMPNIRMVERGGEVYPVVDKIRKTVEIPLVSGNPFGDSSDDDDEDLRTTRTHEIKTYNDIVNEQDGENDEEVDEEIVDKVLSRSPSPLDPSEDGTPQMEDENVCFGDEYEAEPLAMGRNNDGVKVANVGQRQYVSMAEYCNFVLQDRQEVPCRYQGSAGPLGQLATIDWACRIREARMAALTAHRAEFARSATRNRVFEFKDRMVRKKLNGQKKLGLLVTLPATTPGTAKYQRELVMNAVTVSNKLGSPDLFLTFTGNPGWQEIKEECHRLKCQWADIPEFVNKVFKTKFEMFLDDVIGMKKNHHITRDGFVEFQQRGMPHVHLLLALECPITNSNDVNRIITAEVPDLPTNPSDPDFNDKMRYYEHVKGLMTHFPCKDDVSAYWNEGKKSHWTRCSKGFPHDKTPDTVMCDNHYPKYKRSSNNVFQLVRNGNFVTAGSEYIVSHNPFLLMKYGCHINVEVVSSIKTMKYMFKYIFKGADRVLLEASENLNKTNVSPDSMTLRGNVFAPANLNPAKLHQRKKEAEKMMKDAGIDVGKDEYVALNESSYMMDMSAMTACEAVWIISGFPMHGSSHIVHRGYIHEEGNDIFYIKRGVSEAQAEEMLSRKSEGMMEAWFEANQHPVLLPGSSGLTTNDLTLIDMFSFFRFDMKRQKFVLRKKNYSDRIIGRIQSSQPRYLQLMATRLLAQTVTGPKSWEELRTVNGVVYKTCLEAARAKRLMNGEDEWDAAITEVAKSETPVECRRFFASILLHSAPANPSDLWMRHWTELVDNKPSWNEQQKKAHALRHIRFLLANHGMKLRDYELDDHFDADDLPEIDPRNDLDNPEASIGNPSDHEKTASEMYSRLNEAQRTVVDRALDLDAKRGEERMMFIDGPGGTGKTFVYTSVYHKLRSLGRNVICVAHTGQAASLLPRGCTSHRIFSIPLEVNDNMTCNIAPFTDEGDSLAAENTLAFGGVLVMMGGDWRQILPIVEGIQGSGVVEYTLKNSDLWSRIEKFYLIQNQRAIDDPDYAKMTLAIGNGSNFINTNRQHVLLPEDSVERGDEKKLFDWVFPNVNDISSTKSAAILTMDNKTSLRINEMVLDKLEGKFRGSGSICSRDTVWNATSQTQTESWSTVCSSTESIRATWTVQWHSADVREVIYFSINHPTTTSPKQVFLHRVKMTPSGTKTNPAEFTRLQYPIRLAYASTVNKSQGMTLSRCGLVLHSNVFSHGQLYVAMSRVRRADDFRLWHYRRHINDDFHVMGGILVRNVVFKDVLRDDSTR